MRQSRRKALIRVVERAAIALALLDVVVYFAVVRPLRSLRTNEEIRHAATRERLREVSARVERLEQFQATVPQSEEQLKVFLSKYVSSRRQGFSRAARLVRRLTELSQLQLASIAYKLDPSQNEPLRRLGIELEVDGPFPSLFKFAHALETTSDLLLVREFAFEPGEGGILVLRLGIDLYLKP